LQVSSNAGDHLCASQSREQVKSLVLSQKSGSISLHPENGFFDFE
jgi:hypothetical protein